MSRSASTLFIKSGESMMAGESNQNLLPLASKTISYQKELKDLKINDLATIYAKLSNTRIDRLIAGK